MSLLSLSSSVFLNLFKEWVYYKDFVLLYQSLSRGDRHLFVKIAINKDNGAAILRARSAEFVSWEESQWLLKQFGIVAKSKLNFKGDNALPAHFVEWNLGSMLRKDHLNAFKKWPDLERIHLKCAEVQNFFLVVDLFATWEGKCSIRVHNEQYDWSVTYDASKKSLRFYRVNAPSAELVIAAIPEVRTMLVYCKNDTGSNYLQAFKKYADTLEELLIDKGDLPALRLAEFPNLTSLTAHKVTGAMEMGALQVIKLYRLQYEDGFLSVGMEDEPQQLAALLTLSQQFPVRKLKLMRELSVQETELLLGHHEQLEELEVQYCDFAELLRPLQRIVSSCTLKEVRCGYITVQQVEQLLHSLASGPSRASLTSIHFMLRIPLSPEAPPEFTLTPFCTALPKFTALSSFSVTFNNLILGPLLKRPTMSDIDSFVDLLTTITTLTHVLIRDLLEENTFYVTNELSAILVSRTPSAWWDKIAILYPIVTGIFQALQARTLPFAFINSDDFDLFKQITFVVPLKVTAIYSRRAAAPIVYRRASQPDAMIPAAVWRDMLSNWKLLDIIDTPQWTVCKHRYEMTVRLENKILTVVDNNSSSFVSGYSGSNSNSNGGGGVSNGESSESASGHFKDYCYSVTRTILSFIKIRDLTVELTCKWSDALVAVEAILPLFTDLKALKIVYFEPYHSVSLWKKLLNAIHYKGLEKLIFQGEPVAVETKQRVEQLTKNNPALLVRWEAASTSSVRF